MNNLDKVVISKIETGKYNRYTVDGQSVNLCNVFVDDVLKDYGIEMPRLYETAPEMKGRFPGWEDAPTSPILGRMESYFKNRSAIKDSGVDNIDSKTAQELANNNVPVIFISSGHTTLVAPNKEGGVRVYRQDQADRGLDNRVKVGVRNPDGEYNKYYVINPSRYKRFNEYMRVNKGLTHEDITYGMDFYKSNSDLFEEKINQMSNFFNFLNNNGLGF